MVTRENRLLIPYSVVAGIVATAGGWAVAACASALTFVELCSAVTLLLSAVFGIVVFPLFAAHLDFLDNDRKDR